MNEALVVILAFIWALLLLPGALRSRRSNPQATVGGFSRAMDVLRQRPDGRSIMVPADADRIVTGPGRGPDPVIAKRRRAFVRMLAATAATVLAAVVFGGFLWSIAVLTTVVLAGYTVLLRRWKLQRDDTMEVVRELRRAADAELGPTVADAEPVREAVGADLWTHPVQVATRPDDPWAPRAGVRIRRWDG